MPDDRQDKALGDLMKAHADFRQEVADWIVEFRARDQRRQLEIWLLSGIVVCVVIIFVVALASGGGR